MNEHERPALEWCIFMFAFTAPFIWNLIGAVRRRTVVYPGRLFSLKEEVGLREAPVSFWLVVVANLLLIAFFAALGIVPLLGSLNR